MRLLRSWLLDLSGRRPVLDGADDCGENSTGHAATGHLADDAADIRCRGAIGEQRNQHTEELSPGAAADRTGAGGQLLGMLIPLHTEELNQHTEELSPGAGA